MATSCASAAPRLAAVLQGRSSKSFKGGRVAPKKDRATRRTGGGARVSRVFATSTDPKAAAESVDGDVIANNAASLDGKLRTLVVGVADERGDELLAHRNRDPSVLFRHQRWVDAYKVPGQYITITDVDSGKQITKQISVSPVPRTIHRAQQRRLRHRDPPRLRIGRRRREFLRRRAATGAAQGVARARRGFREPLVPGV
jgi:hypothetical protein